ncbi:putative phosphatidylinositol-4-phosphate 5-kinase [Medicago truncatula]|uniref:Putative phosphatidylinositol-4-phosphate 5-kinase n=1 Tax=Medicago truncatula TaxID=3880 RepID=A0A396GV22_MEDTR|nr:putative phosphatidylinositol-4-phosphate 5-kinase [Medicago truncatula]
MNWANGDVFNGCWSNGLRHGSGVYRFANGDVYFGNFKSNLFHGHGKFTWWNGTIYEGDWVDGERTGNKFMIPSLVWRFLKRIKSIII